VSWLDCELGWCLGGPGGLFACVCVCVCLCVCVCVCVCIDTYWGPWPKSVSIYFYYICIYRGPRPQRRTVPGHIDLRGGPWPWTVTQGTAKGGLRSAATRRHRWWVTVCQVSPLRRTLGTTVVALDTDRLQHAQTCRSLLCHVCVCLMDAGPIYIYKYIYVCIQRERERESILHISHVCMYVYRERVRESVLHISHTGRS